MRSDRPEDVAAGLAEPVRALVSTGPRPVVVGLDGRSGSGKSTLAVALARRLATEGTEVTVIEGDDFYAGGSATTWDRRSVEERASRVIDWRRQRDVLRTLQDRGAAEYRPFDWHAPDWDSDQVPLAKSVRVTAAAVVVLEGAYSCRPELHDLLDLRVLLDVPADVRRRQLLEREGDELRTEWEVRWSGAEDHYFGAVMPPEAFDLVLGAGTGPAGQIPDRQP